MTTTPAAVPFAIRCDWPTGCAFAHESAGKLAGHLVQDHLVSADVAYSRAKKLEAEQRAGGVVTLQARVSPVDPFAPSHSGHIAAAPAVTAKVTPPPAPKEPPMPFDSKPCAGCKTPFVPTGANAKYCDACRENACTKCKRIAGHSPACPRAGKKRTPKARTAGTSGAVVIPKKYGKATARKNGTKPVPPRDFGSRKSSGLPSFDAALNFLDTQIQAAEERLAKMKAAREGLAMVAGVA